MGSLRIGVDCGGTNTDAVAVDAANRMLGASKQTTSEDVMHGVVAAVTGALQEAGRDAGEVTAVMLGTTQFVNACIQLKGLARVAVVRLCGPATHSLPPFVDMPPKLRLAVGGCYFLASGGVEYDGSSEIAPLDEQQLRGIARQILAAGISCVVVSGVFSPVQAAQEERAAAILQDEAAAVQAEAATDSPPHGDGGCRGAGADDSRPAQLAQQPQQALFVCQSHQVGHLGLLERENAAILNAALLPLAQRLVPACQQALQAAGIRAPLFFTGNDGTLLSADRVIQMPVATFQSGPVNSLRGAALLTGLQHAAVIDIGGTTTDVGMLVGGFPRPAPRSVKFAGAATNFQMPDVLSIGLGGGSLVRFWGLMVGSRSGSVAAGAADSSDAAGSPPAEGPYVAVPGSCTVGPDSVGARLAQEALCLGGTTCTASDVAVRLGRMQLGSHEAVGGKISEQQARAAWAVLQHELEECLDAIKTEAGDVPVVVVGGGAPLCGDTLPGAAAVIVPEHAAVANAVGAAIAQVSGSVDAVYDMGSTAASREAALQQAGQLAVSRAVAAGARPESCQVAAREEVPLAYLPGNVSRLSVKAVGDLDLSSWQGGVAAAHSNTEQLRAASPEEKGAGAAGKGDVQQQTGQPVIATAAVAGGPRGSSSGSRSPLSAGWPPLAGRCEEPSAAQLAEWRPLVNSQGEWLLHSQDLHLIAIGTGILGCGGGGSAGRALLKALMRLQTAGEGTMRVISPAAVPDNQLVVDAGFMGAPTVGLEKLDAHQAEAAVEVVLAAYESSLQDGAGGGAAGGGTAGSTAGDRAGGSSTDRGTALGGTRGGHQGLAGEPAAEGGAAARCGGASRAPAQRRLAALMAGEIGGGNGIEPLVVASRLGLPVVDGDLMGRAFPELQMMTSAIYGMPILPAAVADEKGNKLAVLSAASPAWLERLLRPVCTEMGCSAGFSSCPLTGRQLRSIVVPHSLSLAWRLGSAVAQAQHAKQDAPAAVAAAGGGRVLFAGKAVDVQRHTTGGFARGSLQLEGAGTDWVGRTLRLEFQNEHLMAYERSGGEEAGGEKLLASVPDLVCCMETDNGLPVATEELRYGLRLSVVGLPAHPLLTTPQALAVVGPAAFGYDKVRHTPLAPYAEPKPIPRMRSS